MHRAAPGEVNGGKRRRLCEAQLAERTADLQRLQAEYANYRKRVDRDRAAVREQAVANVADRAAARARRHRPGAGTRRAVRRLQVGRRLSCRRRSVKLGLVDYGEKGDPFDPKIHEALTHSYSADVTEDTCVEILQPGYKVGDRILRPGAGRGRRARRRQPKTTPAEHERRAWPDDRGTRATATREPASEACR